MFLHVCFAIFITLAAAQDASSEKNIEQTDRLPNVLTVKNYDLDIVTKWDDNDLKSLSFEGSVKITVAAKPELDTTEFAINSKNLNLTCNVSVICGEEERLEKYDPSEKYDGYIIKLNKKIEAGEDCVIKMCFSGSVSEGNTGLYLSKYSENGKIVYTATTQFQPNYARRVFPCFDEPNFKATFKLSITRPEKLKPTISNMPIEITEKLNDTSQVKETFYVTPKMSVYLLCFALTQYESKGKDLTNIWARPRNIKNADYALEVAVKAFDFFKEYTGRDFFTFYNNSKADLISVSNFKHGAMENWGALIFREEYIVPDMEEISAESKRMIAIVVVHEITHQWFGDLVTCEYWSYVWLQEGFARLFEYVALDKIAPELNMIDETHKGIQLCFERDNPVTAESMTNTKVVSQKSLEDRFSFFSYDKPSALFRMIEKTIGDETFKMGLRHFLNNNTMGNVLPKDLYKALQKEIDSKKSLEKYASHSIEEIFESWTNQNGYPTIFVETNYTTGKVKLRQVLMNLPKNKKKHIFFIPISLTTSKTPDFHNTTPDYILTKENIVISTNVREGDWIILNKKQEGYYRVNYENKNWLALGNALLKNISVIHTINRAQIIDDVFNFENEIGYETIFKTTQFLENEIDVIPWISAANNVKKILRKCHLTENIQSQIKVHFKTLMKKLIDHLGLEERKDEKMLVTIARNNILTFADILGFTDIRQKAKALFDSFIAKNTAVNPNIRKFIFCVGISEVKNDTWIRLKEQLKDENLPSDRVNSLIHALGCFKFTENDNKIIIDLLADDSLRPTDKVLFLFSMIDNLNADFLYKFMKVHELKVREQVEYSFFIELLLKMVPNIKSTQLKDYESFIGTLKSNITEKDLKTIKFIIKQEEFVRETCKKNENSITSYLKQKYGDSSTATKIHRNILFVFNICLFLVVNY